MGFLTLSYYFMNIYMWSVILSTLIYFCAMFVVANTMMEQKRMDGLMKTANKSNDGAFIEKIAQNPFLLFVIPIVNTIVIFLMIGMVAMIRLHQWGKIKLDILNLNKEDGK